MDLSLSDLIGFIGVGVLLVAYAGLQMGRLSPDKALYSILNALASGLILVSLIYKPNLPSIFIQIFWIAISAYGLARALRARRARKAGHQEGPPPRRSPGEPGE